jgi:hypothetical protein
MLHVQPVTPPANSSLESHQPGVKFVSRCTQNVPYLALDILLEREPNTSILRRFDLPVIGNYFPGYERKIQEMLK